MLSSSPPGPHNGLVTQSRPWLRGTVLTLRGELDLYSADDLRTALDAALEPPGTVVVIDCAELRFCDSSGLDALLRAQAGAAASGSRIELARIRPMILRMLELAGVAQDFRIQETLPC
ncbi:STAS domain-containing protein [Kitasatospora sp. NPDC101235]|uniref:STAS domain-containing protein n=1 Tax=Kitasatospora sp. NPDC101235 TaxID=3364101 RepID=UPI003822E69D